MENSGLAGKILSVILSIVMVFSGIPVGSILNNAGQYDKEQVAQEKMQLIADYFDAIMKIDIKDPVYVVNDGDVFKNISDIPEGMEYIEFDMSSIDNFIAFAEKVTGPDSIYGGDFAKIDFSALEGKRLSDTPALELVYDVIQFMDDNADLIANVLTNDFDFGLLSEVLPRFFGEAGNLGTFDLYELVMELLGVYYEESDYNIGLYADENGTMRLARRNNGWDYEYVGECKHPSENTFHVGSYEETNWVWDSETQTGSDVPTGRYYTYCYTALTDEEKAEYSFDNYFVKMFQSYIRNMMQKFGLNEEDANKFAEGLNVANGGMYAIIPQIVRELTTVGTGRFGDTITHLIREFFVRAYGVTEFQIDYEDNDIRVTGVTSDYPEYNTLLDFYYSKFVQGDYALFDFDLTVNDVAYKMFEASYKEDGTLVFYPYEDTISGKEVGKVIETIFDMHFAVPSDYKPNTSARDYTVTDDATGKKYYINTDGKVFELYESVFPVAETVSDEVIASLSNNNLLVTDNLYVCIDNSLGEFSNTSKLYQKDNYLYTKTTDEYGKVTWKCWTYEEDTTFYKNINASLATICEYVDPYYIYNDDQYDFINGAREVGGGYVDQLNNIIATVLENSCTAEGLKEINWVAGDNKYLNDNILNFIRAFACNFLNEDTTKDIYNLISLFDFFGDFGDKDLQKIGNDLNLMKRFFDAEYYEASTLEDLLLDILLVTFQIKDKFKLFEDFDMPDDVDSLEALATCVVTFTTDTLLPGVKASANYIENGNIVDMSKEEWKDALFDEAFELLLRVTAEYAEPGLVVFTSDEIDNYKLKGWGYLEFLDEIFDRFYVYVEGLVAVCDDLQCELGVYDGNGPWYKISRILNALLPTALFSNCEKTYGNETLIFDVGVFLEEGIFGNLLDMDLSSMFEIITENTNDFNPFYGNNYIKGVLICLQNFMNAVFPGTIADEDIVSPDHLIDKYTLAGIAKRLIKALNERKREIVPVIISWFDIMGGFDTLPVIDVETTYEYFVRQDEDGMYAHLTGYLGNREEVPNVIEIPSEINGLPVRGYSHIYAFEERTVCLPETIKYLDINNGYNYVDKYEVDDSNPYFEVVDDVLYDEDMTDIIFYPRNKADSTFIVPSTVKYIYTENFAYVYNLKTLKINEGTQAIYTSRNENNTYSFNDNLSDIYIPASVEHIDTKVFYEYRWNTLTVHGPINGYAYELYNDTLKHYTNGDRCGYSFEYYIPDELFVTLNTEKQAVKSNIYVYGYSLPGATIKVYDGDKLIGKDNNISASKYSKWEANVPLYQPVDTGSYHKIKVVAEKDGKTVSSQTITVYYEKNAVVFKEFKMTHNNYYSVTVTDETINRIHNMTWIPGGSTGVRVRVLNGNKLAALYLVSKDGLNEYKVPMERSEKDYWIVDSCYLGNPPGVISLEGVIKNNGKLETIQIGGDIKINFLIDPSGNIYEFSTANPIEGVTATVQYYDNETFEWKTWDAEYYEQINPIVTAADGGFKWIVPKGQWRVVCEKDGYYTYTSNSYDIPPEVTGLQYFMETTKAPAIEECYYQNGIVTITFDQFITEGLYKENFIVDGADNVEVVTIDGQWSDKYFTMGYKTINLYCTDADGNFITSIPENVTINNVRGYAGQYINTTVVPKDLTKYYNFTVTTDSDYISVGDVVTVTLATDETIEDDVKVAVSNSAIFDTEIHTYNEFGDVVATEVVEIPEKLTFDENGKASFKLVAGFEGVSYITFKVGGTTNSLCININLKAEAEHVHSYGPLVVVKSTCVLAGYEYQECECGEMLYTPYELAEHEPTKIESDDTLRTDASCRAKATYYYTCKVCDKVLKDGEVLVDNVDYFAAGKTLDHDIDENGGCKNCAFKDPNVKPVCQHNNVTTINVAPTCEKDGLKGKKVCDDCNTVTYDGDVVPALKHKDTLIKKDGKPATCSEVGWKAYEYCTACTYTTYNELPKLDHTPLDAIKENEKAPKCGVSGSYDLVVYCDCGAELSRKANKVDALEHKDADGDFICDFGCGHKFKNDNDGICDECGRPTHSDKGIQSFICIVISFFKLAFSFFNIFK